MIYVKQFSTMTGHDTHWQSPFVIFESRIKRSDADMEEDIDTILTYIKEHGMTDQEAADYAVRVLVRMKYYARTVTWHS